MQQHLGVHSQRRGRRCRRHCGALGITLSSTAQTTRAKKTRHALNARQHVAACNVSSMQTNPSLTPPFLCTARGMGRTCDGAPCCQDASNKIRTNGHCMPSSITLHPTPPGTAPARHAPTSTTLTLVGGGGSVTEVKLQELANAAEEV